MPTVSALEALAPRGETLQVRADARLEPGEYELPAPGPDGPRAVVVLEGLSDVTLDLRGVVLRGGARNARCDQARGVGLYLRDCSAVRVVGGTFSGYRVSVLVDSCRDVVLEEVEVERGFARRLASGAAAFDETDRLALANDGERWLEAYGAGLFVRDSSDVTVARCRVRAAQNGLVLSRSGDCVVEDNDFAWLSGWGVALDAAEGCALRGNRCDAVARAVTPAGRAEDFGAAGFLLSGGSARNELVGNSARGASVGVRLAGTPAAPLHDNRLARNDLSRPLVAALVVEDALDTWVADGLVEHSPTAGFLVQDATRTLLVDNRLAHVYGAGIALQDGADALVAGNEFVDCDQGVVVRGGAGHWLGQNRFEDDLLELVLEGTRALHVARNDWAADDPDLHLRDLRGLGAEDETARVAWRRLADAQGDLPGGRALDVEFASGAARDLAALDDVRRWARRAGP
ncbi:MAG: right-handed parallel beta-helix repeat-containing protein [Planctomycetes bacterium]|nr:right-handed parallel beta-helix repeat-containing protein [Planctomycetota bacterium]